jgi:transposase-like protein
MDQHPTRSRQHRSPAEWQTLLSQFETSGLSVVAFCRRHAISDSSFHRWRTKLAGSHPATPAVETSIPSDFVDLGALMAKPSSGGRLELRLELGAGLTLTLVRN